VWEVLEPIERHVDWMHDAESIVFDGPLRRGVGTKIWCVTKVGPVRLIDRMEITAWEPNRTMGVRHTGVVSGSGQFTLAPIDDGAATRFTWTERLTFPWYLGGPLGGPVGAKVLEQIWKRNLQSLADLVEPPT
jgi:hypothetical protein